jgi:uncharacterized protein (DUF1501 family)
MATTRREFLAGCGAAATMIASSRLRSVCFAAEAPAAPNFGIVVVVFLRGGMDGLHLVAPANDKDYVAARPPELRVEAEGDNAGLALQNSPAGLDFRLHPSAKALKPLYDANQLAIVHACGLITPTRSHRQATDYMERGITEARPTVIGGWLARHLLAEKPTGFLPAVATPGGVPLSLRGFTPAASIPDPGDFTIGDENAIAFLRGLYQGDSRVARAGARTLDAMKAVQERLPRNDKGEVAPYEPENGAAYPDQGELGIPLRNLARLIKMDVGLRAATVDFEGWDTHQNQAGRFPGLVEQLAGALAAFHGDLSGYHNRLTVVVKSEFGRRLKPNAAGGTGHGRGGVMLALGANVNGGRMYGAWPGLAAARLENGADLAVTTDYRAVLAELLVRRLGASRLAATFPGLENYRPLNLFKGADVKTDLG